MKVAAYCRVSTDKSDQLGSLEMQKGFFTQYTEQNQYQLVKLYADEGISGTKIRNRKQFQQLMEDAKQGCFDMVLVKDISRFARNTVDFLQSIRALKSWGIETRFLTANMSVLGNSEFVLTIFGALAQEESANISNRIKFGKKCNAQKGKVPNLVYGYDKTIGDCFSLKVNEKEAETVRTIYRWYTEDGYGQSKIAQMLDAHGSVTKRGFKWSQNAVGRILTNPIYIGQVINGKEEVTDFLTGTRQACAKEDWIVARRPALAILSIEQFEKAQQILKDRNGTFGTQKTRQSNRHLFSTLIRCKECGYSFRRLSRAYQNTYIRWVCSGRNSQGVGHCSNAVILDENWLIEKLEDYFYKVVAQDDEFVDSLKSTLLRTLQRHTDEQQESKQLQRQLEQSKRARQRWLELFADHCISREELDQKLAALLAQTQSLQHQLQCLDWEEINPQKTRLLLQQHLPTLKQSICLTEWTNAKLKEMVARIEVDSEGNIDVFLNHFGKKTVHVCDAST